MAQIRVNPGDNLWKIAKANPLPGVTITERIRQIAAASNLSDPNAIKPGQVLIVPGGQETPTPRARPDPQALARGRQMDTRGPVPAAGAMPDRKIGVKSGGLFEMEPAVGPDRVAFTNDQFAKRRDRQAALQPMRGPQMQTPIPPIEGTPIGNLSQDSFGPDMAIALMTPDFAAADPAGTAGQVMNLPEDMNAAQFPSAGAETPTVDALNQQQVLTNMDPAQRQALLAALMGMQGQGM
jgi:hypothetical protein